MSELWIRVSGQDPAFIERLYDSQRSPGRVRRPDRLVVDAQVAKAHPQIADTARRAGVPYLVDPMTHFVQDVQHAADPWARLPFADARALHPPDLASDSEQGRLVAECLSFQIACGATALVAPYVHIERADDGWVDVQRRLLAHVGRFMDEHDLRIPVVVILGLGWRLLERVAWPAALSPILEAVQALGPATVALAAGKADQGAYPEHRLADLLGAIERIGSRHPVLAWNQGLLGEACVAGGAIGYEVGIGWRERCDLRAASATHRRPSDRGPGARPVYIESLRRSIPQATLRALLADRSLIPHLACSDHSCCPSGPSALLGDARAHSIMSRLRSLDRLDGVELDAWKWQLLTELSGQGLQVADRIDVARRRGDPVSRFDTSALRATCLVAGSRRRHAPRLAA